MPVNGDNLQVVISYRDLVNLLNAAQRVDALDRKMDRIIEQNKLLRGQFTELMEEFKKLW